MREIGDILKELGLAKQPYEKSHMYRMLHDLIYLDGERIINPYIRIEEKEGMEIVAGNLKKETWVFREGKWRVA